jgi:hypothetical protein
MTKMAERLLDRYYGNDEHPYRTLELEVEQQVRPEHTLLDAGCGRTAPVLRKYRGRVRRLIGVDLVEFDTQVDGIELLLPSCAECTPTATSSPLSVEEVLQEGEHFLYYLIRVLNWSRL